MKEKYTPLLISTWGKVAVLLGTASLLAAGMYGTSEVKFALNEIIAFVRSRAVGRS